MTPYPTQKTAFVYENPRRVRIIRINFTETQIKKLMLELDEVEIQRNRIIDELEKLGVKIK